MIVELNEPRVTVTLDNDTPRPKSGGGRMMRFTIAECCLPPPDPVIVNVYCPTTAVFEAVTVITDVNGGIPLEVIKDTVTPSGVP